MLCGLSPFLNDEILFTTLYIFALYQGKGELKVEGGRQRCVGSFANDEINGKATVSEKQLLPWTILDVHYLCIHYFF